MLKSHRRKTGKEGRDRYEGTVCQLLYPGEASRTLRLCRVAIEAIHTTFPTAEVGGAHLDQEALLPCTVTLAQRHALEVAQAFDHPMFRYARQFAAADVILVGRLIGEYQFPALLRVLCGAYLR